MTFLAHLILLWHMLLPMQSLPLGGIPVGGGGGGGISLISGTISGIQATVAGNQLASTVSTPVNTTGGNFIGCVVTYYGALPAPAVSSHLNAGPWSGGTAQINGNTAVQIFYKANATVGAGEYYIADGSGTGGFYPSIICGAFSGLNASTPQDQQNGNAAGSGTTISPGSVTTGTASLIIQGTNSGNFAGGDTATINAGYVTPTVLNGTGGTTTAYATFFSYIIQTVAGSSNPTWTFNTSEAATTAAAYSFKQ